MTTLTQQELKEHLDVQNEIASDCIRYLYYYEYLKHNKEYVKNQVTDEFQILWQAAHVFYERAIIEICKLIDNTKNQHYNIPMFLSNLTTSKILTPQQTKIYKQQINTLITQPQEILGNKTCLGEVLIKHQRNKFFAHTDKNRDDKKSSMYFIPIKELAITLKKIIAELRVTILEESQMEQALANARSENDLLDFLAQHIRPFEVKRFNRVKRISPLSEFK